MCKTGAALHIDTKSLALYVARDLEFIHIIKDVNHCYRIDEMRCKASV